MNERTVGAAPAAHWAAGKKKGLEKKEPPEFHIPALIPWNNQGLRK